MLAATLLVCAAPVLAAAPEAPVTQPASSVTATSATLNGELNPGASATAGYEFTYNTGPSCEGNTTEAGAEATGEAIEVSTPLSGLEPSREYTFCVIATHLEGETTETTSGAPESFKTLPLPPAVDFESQSASGTTPFEAHVEALVNPNNQITTCNLEYGPTAAYGTTVPCEPASLEGFGDQGVGAAITALEPDSVYHYRITLENASSEVTHSADDQVETVSLEAPLIDGESVSGVGATRAALEAQINPNYQEATYSFEYGLDQALATPTVVAGLEPFPAGFGDQSAFAALSGLTPRTTYYYRAAAQNKASEEEGEPARGAVQHFTTLATPAVTTGTAGSITRTSAVLEGTVNPSGAQSTYHFAYISDPAYKAAVGESAEEPFAKGQVTPEHESLADYEPHAIAPLPLGELTPGTTYDYLLVATNQIGTTTATDVKQFTTLPPTGPTAVTGEATGVSQLSATISGTVDTAGLPTSVEFELGTAPTPGQGIDLATVASEAGTSETIQASFIGVLQPGVTYYYRALANNSDGSAAGQWRSFTTPAFSGQPGLEVTPLVAFPASVLAPLTQHEPNIGTGKSLTKKQKLAKALKACNHKPKNKRSACRRAAKRRFR